MVLDTNAKHLGKHLLPLLILMRKEMGEIRIQVLDQGCRK